MRRDVQTGILIIDEIKMDIYSYNNYIYEKIGVRLEEIVNKNINTVFSVEEGVLYHKNGTRIPVFYEESRIFIHSRSYKLFIIWDEEYEIEYHPIYKNITNNSFDLIQVMKKDLTISFASKSHENIFDVPPFMLEGNNFLDYIYEEDKSMVEKYLKKIIQNGGKKECFLKLKIHNQIVDFECVFSSIVLSNQKTEYITATMKKMNLKKDEMDSFIETEQMFHSIFSNNPDGVFSLDLDFRFSKVNQSFIQNITAGNEVISKDQVIGLPITSYIHPNHFISVFDALDQARNGEKANLATKLMKGDGTLIHVHLTIFPNIVKDKVVGLFGIVKDINELMEEKEKNHRLAYQDSLTKLPNRMSFSEDLEALSKLFVEKKTKGESHTFSLMYFDLDGFKKINDNFGHDAGDMLLIGVANRVKSVLPKQATLYRMSGDEFTIIVNEYNHKSELEQIAKDVLMSFNDHFSIGKQSVLMTSSIGISVYPEDTEDPEELRQFADTAMYYSKNNGKNFYTFYSPEVITESTDSFYINQYLPKSITNNEMEVYFQPIYSTKNNRIMYAESLLRWKHPKAGYVPPDVFIPLSELSGFILKLGNWALEEVFKTLKLWKESGLELLPICVNISGKQFEKGDISNTIKRLSEKHSIDSKYIIVEITESVALNPSDFVLTEMEKLRKLGCEIMIDDFGTGYSSLVYLKDFSVNALKIDKEFIKDFSNDKIQQIIVGMIIELGKALHLNIIVEGVEDASTKELLIDLGVDYLQGFHYSEALDSEKFIEAFKDSLC